MAFFSKPKSSFFPRKVQDRFFVVSKGGPGGTFVDSCALSTDFRDPPGYLKMSLFGHFSDQVWDLRRFFCGAAGAGVVKKTLGKKVKKKATKNSKKVKQEKR